jgi:trans-2-enoyl-CoA reductase
MHFQGVKTVDQETRRKISEAFAEAQNAFESMSEKEIEDGIKASGGERAFVQSLLNAKLLRRGIKISAWAVGLSPTFVFAETGEVLGSAGDALEAAGEFAGDVVESAGDAIGEFVGFLLDLI